MSDKSYVTQLLPLLLLFGCQESATGEGKYVSPGGGGTSPSYLSYQGEQIYVNGVNTAWLSFASDFGSGLDESRATQMFAQVKSVGGNSVRWWVHTNGTMSPVWSADKSKVADASYQAQVIADMKLALDLAAAQDMYVIFNLWSFDMLAITQTAVNSVVEANYRMLTDSTMRQSYVDNFISPLLDEIAGHPALLAIDLFNEPENMTESWFRDREGLGASYGITLEQIHQTTAILSAAIHDKAALLGKEVLVTTGPKSLGMYNTDGFGGTNYYSDENLIAYAGNSAPLDFYAPHYYDDMGKEGTWSPFYHKASYWELDKPIVIGEFFADDKAYKPASFNYFNDSISEAELCVRLGDNEYAGGLSWQWNNQYSQSTINCVAARSGKEPEPSSSTIGFESGVVPIGFSANSETGATPAISVIDSDSYSGSHALQIQVDEQHTNEKKIYLQLPVSGFEFDKIGSVTLYVKLSADLAASGISGGKLFAKDGDWNWSEGDWVSMSSDVWTKVSWDMASPPDSLNELGLQLYGADGSQSTTAVALIDDVDIKP